MIEFEVRTEEIDGMGEWLWIKGDGGLWSGPRNDWKTHKQKILKYCKNFRVAVQAGGGCGMYPRLLSQIFDVVYTFEPVEENFFCLTKNCYGRKVIKFNCAVGPSPSLVSMRGGNDQNRGTAKVEERGNSFIPQMTIDQIKYRNVDLIMLDIEGTEEEALKGAMETMHKFSPVVFVERGDRTLNIMDRIGYKVVDSSVFDTIFAKP